MMSLTTDLQGDQTSTSKPLTVTVARAKQLTGLGYTTIWGLIKDQKLQVVRVGRRTLITYRSLEALVLPDETSET